MPRKTGPRAELRVDLPVASMRPRPDAAENPGAGEVGSEGWPGFNEAAARCRGKLAHGRRAAEMQTRFNEAAARCRGKHGFVFHGSSPGGRASMRPRPDAAENVPLAFALSHYADPLQ